MPKRTFKPSSLKHKKEHGFRARTKTAKGKKVVRRRILKGRHSLTV